MWILQHKADVIGYRQYYDRGFLRIAERQNPSEDVIEKDEVTKAVESAIFEDDSNDFSDEDTNPDCFRCIAEYMAKEGVDSVHFWTDDDGLIHCDVQIKTVYKVQLEDTDKN